MWATATQPPRRSCRTRIPLLRSQLWTAARISHASRRTFLRAERSRRFTRVWSERFRPAAGVQSPTPVSVCGCSCTVQCSAVYVWFECVPSSIWIELDRSISTLSRNQELLRQEHSPNAPERGARRRAAAHPTGRHYVLQLRSRVFVLRSDGPALFLVSFPQQHEWALVSGHPFLFRLVLHFFIE